MIKKFFLIFLFCCIQEDIFPVCSCLDHCYCRLKRVRDSNGRVVEKMVRKYACYKTLERLEQMGCEVCPDCGCLKDEHFDSMCYQKKKEQVAQEFRVLEKDKLSEDEKTHEALLKIIQCLKTLENSVLSIEEKKATIDFIKSCFIEV